jgi:hypothetical protein
MRFPGARLAAVGVALAVSCAAQAQEVPGADALIKLTAKSAKSLAMKDFARLANGNPVLGTVVGAGAATTLSGVLIVYKAQDLAVDLGLSAVGREDRTIRANLVLVNADAAILKGLRAQGVDLNRDPRALAAKQRLAEQRNRFEATEQGGLAFALAATTKHLPYAVAEVGGTKLLGLATGKAFKKVASLLKDYARPVYDALTKNTIGEELRMMLGNRSAFASGLRYAGWSKLGARASRVKEYTDKLVDKLAQSILDETVKKGFSAAMAEAFDNLYRETMEQHPSRPAPVRVRQLVLSRPEVFAPVALPVLAAPQAVAAVPVAVAVPLPALRAPDPVVQRIEVEDHYIVHTRHSSSSSSSSASSSASSSSAPPPEPPRAEPPRMRSPPASRMPSSINPGRGSWDGNRRSLYQ